MARGDNCHHDQPPDACQDIEQEMADAADPVEARHALRQFVDVEGD